MWDESSVKVDHSKSNQRILYIQVRQILCHVVLIPLIVFAHKQQMEFCSTTLRKLIDDQALIKMEASEMWRLTRQIIEALVYIHSRNIIHRDLVSMQIDGFLQYISYPITNSIYILDEETGKHFSRL